jgi:hypothetical protein
MAGLHAAWRRGNLRTRRISRATSARSEKIEFTGWAPSGHAAVQI